MDVKTNGFVDPTSVRDALSKGATREPLTLEEDAYLYQIARPGMSWTGWKSLPQDEKTALAKAAYLSSLEKRFIEHAPVTGYAGGRGPSATIQRCYDEAFKNLARHLKSQDPKSPW